MIGEEYHFVFADGRGATVLEIPSPDSHPRYSTALPCEVHGAHLPKPHVNEVHHIWPRGMGGPDVVKNRIVICATGHNNVHQLLTMLVKNNGLVTGQVLRTYGKGDRKLAQLGYERYKAGDVNVFLR